MKGKLTISLDCEYGWGHASKSSFDGLEEQFERTATINRRLLEVFDRYQVRITWALVGAVIEVKTDSKIKKDLKECGVSNIVLERYMNLEDLVQTSKVKFIDTELIKSLSNSLVDHDIGSHTYSHHFLDEVSSRNVIRDCELMSIAMRKCENQPVSLVFPKNIRGHLGIYKSFGYKIFRGGDSKRYKGSSRLLNVLITLFERLFVLSPQTVNAYLDCGLVNIPGSLLFRIRPGAVFSELAGKILLQRAKRGLHRAVKCGETLHVWWHPFNFAFNEEMHFKMLDGFLKEVVVLVEADKLEILTMKDQFLTFQRSL